MAAHCGRNASSALLRALVEAESRPARAVLGRMKNQHQAIRHINSCGILASHCTKLPHPSHIQMQTRSFLNLAAPFIGNKRMDYSESKVLGYSIEQMFDIVASVENYKFFVPWCKSSKVLSTHKEVTKAELEVGFPPIVERYVSKISVIPQHQIRAVCNDGKLFSHLETVWRFSPGLSGRPDTCTLEFYVSFEFKSLLHSHLATVFFDEVAKQMVLAFENQAARTYGRQNIPLRAAKRRAVQ
ncbi:coenzyme Q-binding protein COQ10 homolog B, mitochondrial-like [Pelobates fuscus]|uniref:coenzyme Q-binding protein COQ10 homolog B, mitochondrial-like n=1 Tax=Pelobates fuscus TaxID=191477 RepID=UPI002FE4C2BD